MTRMTRVAVSSTLLRWARERSGQGLVDLVRAFPKLPEWESGDVQPTLRQLELYAARTHTPFGYFFLDEPPADRLPIPSFRTVHDDHPDRPSPELLDTVFDMLRRQEWMREHRIGQGWEPLAFVGVASSGAKPDDVAAAMRRTLGLEGDWASRTPSWQSALSQLRTSAERLGVLVMVSGIVGNNTHRPLNPKEFRGFVLSDQFAPLVFINGADAKSAQIFTLAHELVHLWFNLSAAFDLRGLQPSKEATESACNAIAAEFLIPRADLSDAWVEAQGSGNPYEYLARRFKVSKIVTARRLLDLGYLTREQFFHFYEEYLTEDRQSRQSRGGGDFIVNLDYKVGRPFADAVIGAAKEGALLYSEAYGLIGVRGDTFEKLAARIGWNG